MKVINLTIIVLLLILNVVHGAIIYKGATLPQTTLQPNDTCSANVVLAFESSSPIISVQTQSNGQFVSYSTSGTAPLYQVRIDMNNIPRSYGGGINNRRYLNVTVLNGESNSISVDSQIYFLCIGSTDEPFGNFSSYYQNYGSLGTFILATFRGRYSTPQTQTSFTYNFQVSSGNASCYRVVSYPNNGGDLYKIQLFAVPTTICYDSYFKNVTVQVTDGTATPIGSFQFPSFFPYPTTTPPTPITLLSRMIINNYPTAQMKRPTTYQLTFASYTPARYNLPYLKSNGSSVSTQTQITRVKGNLDNCTFMTYQTVQGNLLATYENTITSFGQATDVIEVSATINYIPWTGNVYGSVLTGFDPFQRTIQASFLFINISSVNGKPPPLIAISPSLPSYQSFDYPYGISGQMSQIIRFRYLLYYPNSLIPPQIQYQIGVAPTFASNPPNQLNPNSPDGVVPELYDIIIERVKSRTIIKAWAAQSNYGILSIQFNSQNIYMDERHLINGTIYSGWYEMNVDCSLAPFGLGQFYYIKVVDRAYQSKVYNSNQFLPKTLRYIPLAPIVTIDDFKSIVFSPNIVDVTNNDAKVTLLVSLKSMDLVNQLNSPVFSGIESLFSKKLASSWNDRLKAYQFDIIIPRNTFEGAYPYSVVFDGTTFDSSIFVPIFGESSKLTIISKYADMVIPFFTSISWSISVNPITNISQVTWEMSINDDPNGFDHGYVKIISDMDYKPYYVNITSDDRVGGDAVDGVYRISLEVSNPVVQTLTLYGAYLCDTCGNCGESNQLYQMDPLALIINGPKYNGSANIVLIPRAGSQQGDIKGTLTGLPSSIDVGGSLQNRTLSLTVTLEETRGQYGISDRHNPVIYFQSMSTRVADLAQPLSFEMERDPFQLGHVYRSRVVIPYGFGNANYPIAVSVYGFASNDLRFGEIFNITMQRGFTQTSVNLQECSMDQSNIVTLIGNNLIGSDNSVSVQFEPFFASNQFNTPTYTIIYQTSTMLQINLTSNVPTQSYNVYVIRPALATNTSQACYIGITTSPSNNSCPNGCSQNGFCSGTNCICNRGWSGVSCESTIIQVNNTFNSSNPSVISVDVDSTIKSIVTVVALQEVDSDATILRTYPFTSWNTTSFFIDDRTRYFYKSNLIDQSDSSIKQPVQSTVVKVTIEEFNKTVNYTFANQQLLMVPGSIKFTIEMDEYQFQNQLSTLRLLMSTTIESTSGDACLNTDQGSSGGGGSPTIDSNWFSLRVNDKSIFGRFIKVGLVDNRLMSITTNFLDQKTNGNNINQLISIEIPNYGDQVVLDPDFSFLVSENDGDCSDGSGLSMQQIAGIIVGSVVGAFILVGIGVYILRRKYRVKFSRKKLVVVRLQTMK